MKYRAVQRIVAKISEKIPEGVVHEGPSVVISMTNGKQYKGVYIAELHHVSENVLEIVRYGASFDDRVFTYLDVDGVSSITIVDK